ncbi:N-acetylglucosaminyldiphosphoundecaprenol N-acetyl-beta-D-mannosaminyltransferase [Nitrosospira multiformis]|uniref:N-acetylglucosaminyldiphosphoundecaprenol N-acetyl-beta-D-mannosaminyltransferase n=1 Tax=Nitrosospira multiformis TaxID=1231 RepID=A0A2T5IB35_9PROT|nr:WecB/TagA/CpsF family glycosyltransferase [Nitrosospira multiformis]PTQ81042.1 N-acetylglucosaminyldiphosphoundecaprenol N-acetyl-beta-D-mannosaminyltransferase [Nitrosospira multiformis]
MNQKAERLTTTVLHTPIDVLTWVTAIGRIQHWAALRESRYVCICNVHSVVTATQDTFFQKVLYAADMATADGAPIAWMLRHRGFLQQQRINGPDLMWRYCEEAARRGESIYLYGSSPETLNALQDRLIKTFPRLKIAGAVSPPFRPLTDEEDQAEVARINNSGAGTVWVSLGCPKQEKWMASHKGRVNAVMIGVGAAFDYHAGTITRAPLWMQKAGLEWLVRLIHEPRRLWKRYLITNTLFIWFTLHQLFFKER